MVDRRSLGQKQGYDEETDVHARQSKNRHNADVRTWEDVRYIYEDSKSAGRKVARDLLDSKYHFMTIAGSQELQVYDEDTGRYTTDTSDIQSEIYEGLQSHWSTHELNEITAGLRQQTIVPPQNVDGAQLEDPHRCVANGVINMLTGELKPHNPTIILSRESLSDTIQIINR
jgi:hypothetical protein